ncbi:MAG TPA: hypothetical protein VNN09_05520 [Candidatus Competibacteraceae bacterium]|nr:hypothetical protein [Candidatus Competibacteraceae bacterium]
MEREAQEIVRHLERTLARELNRDDLELFVYRHCPQWSERLETLWQTYRRRRGKLAAIALQA